MSHKIIIVVTILYHRSRPYALRNIIIHPYPRFPMRRRLQGSITKPTTLQHPYLTVNINACVRGDNEYIFLGCGFALCIWSRIYLYEIILKYSINLYYVPVVLRSTIILRNVLCFWYENKMVSLELWESLLNARVCYVSVLASWLPLYLNIYTKLVTFKYNKCYSQLPN